MADERFSVATLGTLAGRGLGKCRVESTAEYRVAHVFDRSFAIESPSHRFVCIGAAGVDNGPLNAICREAVPDGWRCQGVAEGQAVSVSDGLLQLDGGPGFDLTAAVPWQAPSWPSDWNRVQLTVGLESLETLAAARAPCQGLARVAFPGEPSVGTATGLARVVLHSGRLKCAALADWLARSIADGSEPAQALDGAARLATHGLLGLGPGLTPSGDDLLAGMSTALQATGAIATATALARFVADAPDDSTTPLSRAFLEAALEGLPTAALHAAITAILRGNQPALPTVIDRLEVIGHTSGWDMLAGAVLGLRAVARHC